jgi:hypothetical protein
VIVATPFSRDPTTDLLVTLGYAALMLAIPILIGVIIWGMRRRR